MTPLPWHLNRKRKAALVIKCILETEVWHQSKQPGTANASSHRPYGILSVKLGHSTEPGFQHVAQPFSGLPLNPKAKNMYTSI